MTSLQQDSQRSPEPYSIRSLQPTFQPEGNATFVSGIRVGAFTPESHTMMPSIPSSNSRMTVSVSSLDSIRSYASNPTVRPIKRDFEEVPSLYADQTHCERTLIQRHDSATKDKRGGQQGVEEGPQMSSTPPARVHGNAHSQSRSWDETQTSFRNFDDYTVVGTIGRGTHGKVLLAYLNDDTFADFTFYAVKVVDREGQSDAELRKELSVLHLISSSHSNGRGSGDTEDEDVDGTSRFLQRLYEVFYDKEHCFITMEYHPATLSDPEISARFRLPQPPCHKTCLPNSPSLPTSSHDPSSPYWSPESLDTSIDVIRLLAGEISLGLFFLHERGIVHQDIKPANIMISHSGHAIIGDFGAVSFCSSDQSSDHDILPSFLPIVLESSDYVTFTPTYAAPELRERDCDGLVVYDARSDWWSLGVLLYEVGVGKTPFGCEGDSHNLRDDYSRRSEGDLSISFGELEALERALPGEDSSEVRTRISALKNFLRSLLAYNPSDRLSGADVKSDPFFNPSFSDFSWEGVTEGRFPPCPNPSITNLVEEGDRSYLLDDEVAHSELQSSNEMIFYTCYAEADGQSTPHPSFSQATSGSPSSSSDAGSGEDQCILRGIPSSASVSLSRPSQFQTSRDEDDVFVDSGVSASHCPPSYAPRPAIIVSPPRVSKESDFVLTLPDWITECTSLSSEMNISHARPLTLELGSVRPLTPCDKFQPPCVLGSPFEESTPAAVHRRLRQPGASSDTSSSPLLHPSPYRSSASSLPPAPSYHHPIDWSQGYRSLEQGDNLPELLTMVLLEAMDIRDKNARRITPLHEDRLYRLHEMVQKKQKRRPRKLKKKNPIRAHTPNHPRKISHLNVSAAQRFWGCMRFWEDAP